MVIMFVIKRLTYNYFEDKVDFSTMCILSHPVEETPTSSETPASSETPTPSETPTASETPVPSEAPTLSETLASSN